MRVLSLKGFLEFSAFELNLERTKNQWRGKRKHITFSKKGGIWNGDESGKMMFQNIEIEVLEKQALLGIKRKRLVSEDVGMRDPGSRRRCVYLMWSGWEALCRICEQEQMAREED